MNKMGKRYRMLLIALFPCLSLYNKPAGMSPYAPQNFPFLSPYLSREMNRPAASVPLTESLSSGYATDRPAAPSYGMITELPLPVPTAETFSQVRLCGEVSN